MDGELSTLVQTYKPNQQVLNGVSKIKLLATVGPSATGKTTIMKALAKSRPDVHYVAGETSRTPRQGEKPGTDMVFRGQDSILQDLHTGTLIQVVTGPNGDLYCTKLEDFPLDKFCLFPLVPLGVRQFRSLPLAFFETAFIVPYSFEKWQSWLHRQAQISNWSQEKLQGRMNEAKNSFEFALNDESMHFILNDQVDKAAERLYQITQRQTPNDEELARHTAEDNFAKLKGLL
jgi:guanylate kinase